MPLQPCVLRFMRQAGASPGQALTCPGAPHAYGRRSPGTAPVGGAAPSSSPTRLAAGQVGSRIACMHARTPHCLKRFAMSCRRQLVPHAALTCRLVCLRAARARLFALLRPSRGGLMWRRCAFVLPAGMLSCLLQCSQLLAPCLGIPSVHARTELMRGVFAVPAVLPAPRRTWRMNWRCRPRATASWSCSSRPLSATSTRGSTRQAGLNG